jgi:uncharacterized membrane protein YkoI
MDTHGHPGRRLAAVSGIVLGLAAGSYGIANAASGSSSAATASPAATTATTQAGTAAPPAPGASNPWGGQRSDETLLTGDAKAKVQALALAKVPGGTIVRIETDADGHAAYEAHMTKQDGTPVTVYVDKKFTVLSVESR